MGIQNLIVKILQNKLSFLGAAILGALIGVFLPVLGKMLGYAGEIFIDVMKMCVMPIVVTSVTLSIAHFVSNRADQNVFLILITSALTLIFCSIIGILTAIIFEPGIGLDTSSSATLKDVVEASAQVNRGLSEPLASELSSGALDVILNLIPSNIFSALAQDSIIQVIAFAIIFGVALGGYSQEDSKLMILMKQILDIFSKIFSIITFIFPVVLLCTVAKQASQVGANALIGMGSFILQFYLAVFIAFLILSILMFARSKASFSQWVDIIKEPLIIALATQSSTASIPTSIIAMKRLNYNPDLVQLIIPLGSIIGRYGNILYFGFCAIFALQMYSIELLFIDYLLIGLMTIIAGISTSGQSGPLSLASLSLILTPLGIPFEGIQGLLIAVDALIDPARTFTIVHTSCAAVSFIDRPLGTPLSLEDVEDDLEVELKDIANRRKDTVKS